MVGHRALVFGASGISGCVIINLILNDYPTPDNFASQMFYYNQCDELAKLSRGKSWTWADIIPDMIVGFVPNNSTFCLALVLGLYYLSVYTHINEKGAEMQLS